MTSPDFRAGLLRSAEMADEAKKLIHGNSRETFVQRAACDYIAKTIHAEAAAIKDEPTTVEIAPPGKHTIISSPQAPLRFKDEAAGRNIDNYCAGLERTVNELRERNARLVEALRLIGQKDHKGRPGWSAGAANKLANEALAANEEPK